MILKSQKRRNRVSPSNVDRGGPIRTPLYPTFKKRTDDAIEQLIKRQVTPWVFMAGGNAFQTKTFDGRQISYRGIGFDGSAREVFWSRYIEPFLENICIVEIAAAVSMAKERAVDGAMLLREVEDLLSRGFGRVYGKMIDVDRRLRGKGFPKSVEPRPAEREVAAIQSFLRERIQAELSMWQPPAPTEEWFTRNQFWVWLIGMLVTLLLGIIGTWAATR